MTTLDKILKDSGLDKALLAKAVYDMSSDRTPIMNWFLRNQRKCVLDADFAVDVAPKRVGE